ncbi:class II fructose-bisphosphate aldolase [Candidatus Tachikawaea gelatinosa]|uniref:Fructose-bisphosphate aldolase n=1 Tax=Candidatus Tachikawaea gelatinosa TaxID=1410383 RepID=A0A090BWI7_9ENTR|nr:class II fructose-bisphosphate aldolase [Candidatus Tachikawaea gelatinosa]BAP58676.1 fructose-bisphosphate aldolase [Candidatus Tachikawaea gelatinosa]
MSKILNYIRPGVVFGSDVQKIFSIAKKQSFAIPAINCIGTDSINAVLETAKTVNSPVIIQFSYSGSQFIVGEGLKEDSSEEEKNNAAVIGAIAGAKYVHFISKHYGIPVILHTDHCAKNLLPWIDKLLDFGKNFFIKNKKPLFSSHMIDLSAETLEENIQISQRYLEKMSKIGMTLEVELGLTGGEEDGINNSNLNKKFFYSNPKDIYYAYKKLQLIDNKFTIAAAFGNVHGVYSPGNVKLMPNILKEAQRYVKEKNRSLNNKIVSFVFHGGSGSSLEDIRKAIKYGVIKMNVDTDIQWATWQGVSHFYKKNKEYLHQQIGSSHDKNQPNKKYYDPRKWLRSAQISIINRLKQTFSDLNCIDRL